MNDGQTDLFGIESASTVKPPREARKLRVLITVKAAPNPSATYGETVCVAGLSADPSFPGWIRLYPINFRDLDSNDQFAKYDIVEVQTRCAVSPHTPTNPARDHWPPSAPSTSPVSTSSCTRLEQGRTVQNRRLRQPSRPVRGAGHKTPLLAPRFIGHYKWRCLDPTCRGHRQQVLDWEFVALQRRMAGYSDDAAKDALRQRFFEEICAPTKDLAFFVGNQAKRRKTFSIIGIYYPPKK